MHRSTTTRAFGALAGSAAVALAIVACGGDDDRPPSEATNLVAHYSSHMHTPEALIEEVEWPEGQGTLQSPYARLTIEALSVAGAYAPDGSMDEAYSAADGHELLVASFDVTYIDATYGGESPEPEDAPGVSWAVAVGDRTEAIEPLETGDSLVVSVPEGDDALLQVTDEDRTQSISLRTGVRADDAVAGLNEPQPSQQLDHTYRGAGVADVDDLGAVPVDAEVTVARAWRTAWHPTTGWAQPGRAWLMAEVAPGSGYDTGSTYAAWVWEWRIGEAAFTLTAADGAPVNPAAPFSIAHLDTSPAYLVFDVPEDATTATLTIAPGEGLTWMEAPSPGQVDIALAPG
jgi:hypothetical protein